MAIPDYADERSYKFFSRSLVGTKHGEGGTGYCVSWNTSAEGLEPTAVYPNCTCIYCGNRANPIQAGLRRPRSTYIGEDDRDYNVTGYACCCKGAMDEGEHKLKVAELKERHAQELEALEKQRPTPDPEVFKAFAEDMARQMARKALDRFKWGKDPVKVARRLAEQARGD
ncbi:conserved hypothetical protein [Pseudomonas sp. OF001]|uniref:hypothetical protein n=1 Tax=Pseudomonas sp. OF001 TaxID=2772300 RepID=UPI00191B7DC5|nr:hypothetical protein [Pseudomonas sp. OF001]CAD5377332.1 conserved hypothetical protein [Pseudomonas sp. OF001]